MCTSCVCLFCNVDSHTHSLVSQHINTGREHRFVHPLSSADMTGNLYPTSEEGKKKTPDILYHSKSEMSTSFLKKRAQNKQRNKNSKIQSRTNISAILEQFSAAPLLGRPGFTTTLGEKCSAVQSARGGWGHLTNTSKSPEDKQPPTLNQSLIFKL